MPKSHPNKKYVESKSTELLLASQMIESSEAKAAKRPPPPRPQQDAPRRRKSRKLDAIKLSIAQKERDRRLARKKTRQAARSTSEAPSGALPQANADPQGQHASVKKTEPKQHQLQQKRKRVVFV
ncbi:hypothetical protein FRC12_001044 [Ceratobasidium sp. 428]|nr:hypothetical protein FRC12_001044 [Ceratobasidium sp. 428]